MDQLNRLLVVLQLIAEKTVNFLEYAGSSSMDAVKAFRQLWKTLFASVEEYFARRRSERKEQVKASFHTAWRNFSMPFRKMARAPRLIWQSFKENGFVAAVKTLFRGIKNNRVFFETIVNYTAPVLGVYLLVITVMNGINAEYALELTANHKVVGYVANEAEFYEAKNDLITRMVNVDPTDEGTVDVTASYQIAKVEEDFSLTDKQNIADTLLAMSSSDVVKAYGLYIDGKFMGVLDSPAYNAVLDTMDSLLDEYRTGMEGERVEFIADIDFVYGLYPTGSLVSSNSINTLLRSNVQEELTYTIEIGDSPIQMANKNGVPYAEFKGMNPGIEERCIAGETVLIATEQPYLSVKTTYQTTYTEAIEYDIVYSYDHDQTTDYLKYTKEGVEGEQEVEAIIEIVNGVETGRTILSTTVLSEPVTAYAIKGTKITTGYRGSYYEAVKGSGEAPDMIWPVGGNGGKISQYYGNYGHRGLDIASCGFGTDILAAASGTVVLSDWHYSYGKCVIVSHGHGVYTLYAHNSSLYVSVGDYVEQGQAIAAAGSTGNSTGVHLHFEVQINGRTVNPMDYLP